MDSARLGTTMEQAGTRWIVCPTPQDEPAERTCWFCGAALTGSGPARRAREHVFARWLLRERGAEKQPFGVAWNDALEENVLDQRSMALASFVAGRVCGDCNHGWMSRVEGAVRDDLAALGRGARRLGDLDDGALATLARWSVKTAFAAQCVALGPKLVPAAHRRALCDGRLDGIRVVGRLSSADLGLATYGTQRWQISYPPRARAEVVAAVARSYKIVLTVGQLVLAVCYWPEPTWPLVISARSHVPVWPARGDWATYEYATDRHGVPPDTTTEIIDMIVGTIVAHPTCSNNYASVPADRLA